MSDTEIFLAVAFFPKGKKQYGFAVMEYSDARSAGPVAGAIIQIVCVNNSTGEPPPDNWRPE